MAGGRLMRRSTRSNAGGARGDGDVGGGITTPTPRGNTRTPKRVSFSPIYAEDSSNDDGDSSDDFTPVSVKVTSTPRARRTPLATTSTPSSSSPTATSRQRARVTPYPYPSSSSSSSESPQRRQRQRRRNRTSRSVFSASTQESKRPQTTLTAQLNYTMEVLPEKVRLLKNSKDMCHAARNRGLEALEANLMKRISIVSGLNVRDEKEETQDHQVETLDHMTSSLTELQDLVETKKARLNEVRPGLRASFNMRYVCCPVCAEEEKKTGKN